MLILALLLALLVGFTMGLLGGGGTVLTVPILVYIAGFSVHTATAYSLFSVGLAALVGALRFFRSKLIDFKAVYYFGIPSMISAYAFRSYVLPKIPDTIFSIQDYLIYKETMIMVLFAVLMVAAALVMLRGIQVNRKLQDKYEVLFLISEGAVIGALTGIVGIGGGFLIVPSLVFFRARTMQSAIGTSLLIIFLNASTGFLSDLLLGLKIEWPFLLTFTLLASIGILVGTWLSKKISNKNLKRIFGYFILILSIYIFIREFLF